MESGHSIIIGLDKILGVGQNCHLSDNLLQFLYENGIFSYGTNWSVHGGINIPFGKVKMI